MSYGHTISLRGDKPPEPDVRPTLVICRGIPASGKTTWALAWIERAPIQRARVNRDDLRQQLFRLDAGQLTRDQENTVTKVQRHNILCLLKAGYDVVSDDTNLRASTVRGLAAVAKVAGARIAFQDFNPDPLLCIERDLKRSSAGGRGVGDEVIRSFAERYIRKGRLPDLPLDEPSATATYTPDPKLPHAWLVDLDGTLAKMTGRSPFQWDRVEEDALNEPIARIVRLLWHVDDIVIVSGRDGSCREQTKAWLQENGVLYHSLFMRQAGDGRKDSVVKSELFWRFIAPMWNVQGVFDDRDQVVEMWRELGLTCLQVAPGDF